MRKLEIILILSIIYAFLLTSKINCQNLKYIYPADLDEILKNPENKLQVINFWASWCPPCVNEMPGFQNVASSINNTEIKFRMISLDYPDKMNTQLIPFLKKYDINLEVDLMMDTDYLKWADMVDPAFKGNIPATLFLNNAKKIRYFHSGEITEKELKNLIIKFTK